MGLEGPVPACAPLRRSKPSGPISLTDVVHTPRAASKPSKAIVQALANTPSDGQPFSGRRPTKLKPITPSPNSAKDNPPSLDSNQQGNESNSSKDI